MKVKTLINCTMEDVRVVLHGVNYCTIETTVEELKHHSGRFTAFGMFIKYDDILNNGKVDIVDTDGSGKLHIRFRI